ncbi:hypothetical protein ACVGXP_12450, partial [Enterobacter hormaechei]
PPPPPFLKAEYGILDQRQLLVGWEMFITDTSNRGVPAPIVGTSRDEQRDELLSAVDLWLTPEQIAVLETPYQQIPVVGFK